MYGRYGNSVQEQQMQAMLEQKQIKDFMRLYATLVTRCFDDCVTEFTSSAASSKEITCSRNCTKKMMKLNERVGLRFAEENQALMEAQAKQ
ncbi:Mitochondrial import inner membrane translocase subunit TIM9 [Zancudomyces culisetae]|uniref:Mitochondrial import inner membrane translocase subunit n=1 Tax=Zancudomyces culisetae TaxID=1213189 RepID=A0A1R1PKH1_ZANCU|nr:Mitochondrial import inner membrane translocase subunit TIM9 [Zancudomyces culisetae]OMH81471.1 Mitochondrial import inner membrane translocase subunit TIM9 [Zancudomyces culisetae]|eukprot:OMH78897.1 Mitochondrial import inner membrane translocase subunit TIM9 [Zancudomyces culisetae]